MNTKFLLSSDNNNRNELLKKKIIHYYIANGDATIADLGREMDLSIPTVTKLVAELQDDGYILDFGKQETNGGRKPNIYGLNPASCSLSVCSAGLSKRAYRRSSGAKFCRCQWQTSISAAVSVSLAYSSKALEREG